MADRLQFMELREANVHRCEALDGFNHKLDGWSPAEWSNAMAGEAGELCNLTKKLLRGDAPTRRALADELADVVIYADLCAARLDIDLGAAVRAKFNLKSAEIGSSDALKPAERGEEKTHG